MESSKQHMKSKDQQVLDLGGNKLETVIHDTVLQHRYKVGKIVSQGSQGAIFDVEDVTGKAFGRGDMVVKFSNDYIALAYEIKVLNKIAKQAKVPADARGKRMGLPTVTAYGMLIGTNLHQDDINPETNICLSQGTTANLFGYYIMPKYRLTLEEFLEESDNQLDAVVVLKIMKGVFKALELVHQAGYTHNDIKTNNIMLDSEQNAYLVDLGFTTRFLDGDGEHLKTPETVKMFRGNILFASVHQMCFLGTSRRDDLTAACYLLLSLLNQNNFPVIPSSFTFEYEDEKGMKKKFAFIKELKK